MPHKPFGLSVKMLIRDDKGRVLFLKRSPQSNWNPGKWDLPGGKVHQGEKFDNALMREVIEETGLQIVIERVLGAGQYETAHHKVIQLILEGRSPTNHVHLSREHDDFAWVDPREVQSLEICGEIKSVLKQLSHPFLQDPS